MITASTTTARLLEALLDPIEEQDGQKFDQRYRPIVVGFARRLGRSEVAAEKENSTTICRPAPRLVLWILSALLASTISIAPAFGDRALAGFAVRLKGETLEYHSPDPDVTSGLLVRSVSADRLITWETAPVPLNFDAEFARFVWLFGIDVDAHGHRFNLLVNEEPWFEIHNPRTGDVRDWTLDGRGGSSLRLRATMIDRFDDLMGYAILTVPRDKLTPGRPLRISVVGENAGSNAWYITFQAPVFEQARLTTKPAIVRSASGNYQPLTLSITHLGPPVKVIVETSFGETARRTLELGGNRFELRHPEVAEPEDVNVTVRIEDEARHSPSSRIEPVRPWTIDLVQHTHTDVGYTRPQTEILPEHLRFIDTALDYCDKTDEYPDEARFRWTCEASWAVREYLESRTPEQIARLRRRVLEGRIEITGMFLNMSEVIDEASYAAFLQPIHTFRERGLPVTTAMQNDINGAAWCLADCFAEIGIEYLTMGQHGHRALVPFDTATSFWWQSPAGNRVLAFRADHYQTGNFWGIHTGKIEPVEDDLLRYLAQMEKSGYPFNRIAIQHSGYPTDNSPPSTASSDFVRAWNDKYIWPKVKCSVAREFPQYVKQNHADELPTLQLAWPDWWTDGFGSAARESAAARLTQARLVAVESLLAMEHAIGLDVPAALASEIDEIRDDLLFYGEHTFGAAESVREPLGENSVVQWAEKAAYAWDAVKRVAVLGEGAMGRLIANVGGPTPQLIVINTLNYPRSGLLELYVDHEQLPVDRPFRLLDENGKPLAVQLLRSRPEGSYWSIWARDIPAFGWRTFEVDVDHQGQLPADPPRRNVRALENPFYRLEVDGQTGAITSLIDKDTSRDLVDTSSQWKLGQVVYETLGNREQLESFLLDDYARRSLSNVEIEGVVDRTIWSTLSLCGELPFCEAPEGVRCEIRLFHTQKRLELHYTIQKRRNFDPEAIYVAFPLAVPGGKIVYETLGGIVEPDRQILPGAASDWQTMQNFAAVQSPQGQVVFSSDEIPLVQFGEINLGKFQRETRVERPHIFSWVMNNYWTTNFRASQEGEFRFSYALTSDAKDTRASASRFGWSHRVPLLGRVLPAHTGGNMGPRPQHLETRSLLPMDVDNLILIAARPNRYGPGILLHLREVEGRPAVLDTSAWRINKKPVRVHDANVLGQELAAIAKAIRFSPHETKFILIKQGRRE